ncbi:MAG: ATP-binding cassette domain-containing protein [Acidobacteria bacterium]|nr:MAG: ATP-binding cassette domain-containing protein [Acidobacteriota bacterium]
MFEQAFRDLASILEPSTRERADEAKGAVAEIVTALVGWAPAVPEEITDLNAQIDYMLRPSGIMRRRVELTGDWWRDAVGCLLGSTTDGDVVAIMPGRLHGYTYKDRSGRLIRVNRKTGRNLAVDAFCFYRPLQAEKLGIADLLRFMLKSLSAADFLFVLTASAGVAMLGLLLPFMNKVIFDSVIPGAVKSMVPAIAALLFGAAASMALFGVVRGIILNRLQQKISLSVQPAGMMRLLALPATFFKEYSAGELSSRIMSLNALCSALSNATLTVGLTALFSVVYLFQMRSFAPALAGPAILILAASLVLSVLSSWWQLRVTSRRMRVAARLNGLIFAMIAGIQKIKLAGAEKRAFARWAQAYRDEATLAYAPPVFLRIHTAVATLIATAGTVWLYYTAGAARVSPADYMAFNVAYGAASGAILALSGIVLTVSGVKPLLEMVQPVLQAVPETSATKKIVTSMSGMIEINGLSFRYTPEGPLILTDFDFKVYPGEYVALVGKTGCGKSTVLRLLLGFEKPESGAIYYDGNNLERLDLSSVRQSIGSVLQTSRLFPGDVFSNIVMTAPWKTMDNAWEAARLAGVEEDIRAMPMGMQTIISEGSGGVSGGQRQRILIARAIISKPSILLFDEATSALDNVIQKQVTDSLAKLRCTRVVVAHRLSTVRDCGRILVMEEGRIVEEGDYQALMARQGRFYELAIKQVV